MKKLLIAAAAALFALTAASAEAPKMYLDGGVDFPVWGNLDCATNVDSDMMTSVGTQVSFRAMFTDLFGAYAKAGFYWPQERKQSKDSKYGGDQTVKATDSAVDEWWGFNGFFGFAIMPVHKDRFGLTVAPGFAVTTNRLIYKNTGSKTTYDSKYFGIGCDVTFDIYLNKVLYLKPAIETTVYFAGDTDLNKDSTTWFTMTPSFAVGVRF